MRIDANQILLAIAIGAGATAITDLWNLFLKRGFGITSLNYCMLGRWVRHMPAVFRHASIAAAPPKSNECAVGWVVHYSIGITLAVAFVWLSAGQWLARPALLPALLYGVGTVVFPFFVMQPSLGLGIASSKSPKPIQARIKSLFTHIVYGLGLYLCALAMA